METLAIVFALLTVAVWTARFNETAEEQENTELVGMLLFLAALGTAVWVAVTA